MWYHYLLVNPLELSVVFMVTNRSRASLESCTQLCLCLCRHYCDNSRLSNLCVMYVNPLCVLAKAVLGYHCIELRKQ